MSKVCSVCVWCTWSKSKLIVCMWHLKNSTQPKTLYTKLQLAINCSNECLSINSIAGLLSLPVDQQEEIRRALFHPTGQAWQDGLQGYRNCQEGQLSSCGNPDEWMFAQNLNWSWSWRSNGLCEKKHFWSSLQPCWHLQSCRYKGEIEQVLRFLSLSCWPSGHGRIGGRYFHTWCSVSTSVRP